MVNERTWSYVDLTAVAEKELINLIHQADRMPNREGKLVMRQWAFGIFSYWSTLTIGSRTTEDLELLEKLAETVGSEGGNLTPLLCSGANGHQPYLQPRDM